MRSGLVRYFSAIVHPPHVILMIPENATLEQAKE
jgi:curved DNA-binding protein CbpA